MEKPIKLIEALHLPQLCCMCSGSLLEEHLPLDQCRFASTLPVAVVIPLWTVKPISKLAHFVQKDRQLHMLSCFSGDALYM